MNRRIALGFALALVACGGGSGVTAPVVDPAAAFVGTWNLSTVNGTAMPVQFTIPATNSTAGAVEAIYHRTLTIHADFTGASDSLGTATWTDSTTSSLACGPQPIGGYSPMPPMCSKSGTATGLLWKMSTNRDTLTVVRISNSTSPNVPNSIVSGYVTVVKTFTLQPDGSILNTGEWQPIATLSEVYRRQ